MVAGSEDPRQRARTQHVADELTLRRAEHAHVVDQDANRRRARLIRVEEHHEEDQRHASATFDQMPSPNHSRNNGARTTRGTASQHLDVRNRNTLATNGDRASVNPQTMPSAAPATKPHQRFFEVTARCPQIIPLPIQRPMRCAMSVGG